MPLTAAALSDRLGRRRVFALNGSLIAAVFLMPQFQQVVSGVSPLAAGLRLLPRGIAPFLLAPRAGALADRTGERALAAAGLLAQTARLAWIAATDTPSISYGPGGA